MTEHDRPSKHGQILGQALALIAMAGRKDSPIDLPDQCLTCAFREGTMPNMTAGTGKVALDCTLGIDKDRFSCHHGMKDGTPVKLCIGYVAARLAPWSFTQMVLTELAKDLDTISDSDPDDVRAAFDRWLAEIDPAIKSDEYRLARAYAVSRPHLSTPEK